MWPNLVSYKKAEERIATDCVSIRPLSMDPEAIVQKAFIAHLAPRVKEGDDCLVTLEGEIMGKRSDNGIVVSRVAAGAKVRLMKSGEEIWSGEHTASTWGGGLPLDPISIVTTLFNAFDNNTDEQRNRVVDDLARRLVSTMPEFVPLQGERADQIKIASAGSVKVEFKPAPLVLKTAIGDGLKKAAIEAYDDDRQDEAVMKFRQAGSAYLAAGDRVSAQYMADILKQIAKSAR